MKPYTFFDRFFYPDYLPGLSQCPDYVHVNQDWSMEIDGQAELFYSEDDEDNSNFTETTAESTADYYRENFTDWLFSRYGGWEEFDDTAEMIESASEDCEDLDEVFDGEYERYEEAVDSLHDMWLFEYSYCDNDWETVEKMVEAYFSDFGEAVYDRWNEIVEAHKEDEEDDEDEDYDTEM